MVNKTCLGCGLTLQDEFPDKPGYVHDLKQDYCVSCFRLRHYGDLSRVTKQKVDPFEMLEKISAIDDALFVWVVDLFHLEESNLPSLHRWFNDAPIVLLATKRELLPKTMSNNKIIAGLSPFIKESHLNIVDVVLSGNYGMMNRELNLLTLDNLRKKSNKEKLVFFGKTNVGKSSLINALSHKQVLSVSALPGTTLDLIKVDSDIQEVYDTPGISIESTLLDKLSIDTVRYLQPKKTIKPTTFQLKGHQALIIDGFGYFEFKTDKKYSVTCYFPESIKLHRTKAENAHEQFIRLNKELNELVDEPVYKRNIVLKDASTDIIVMDLGFMSVFDKTIPVSATFKESVKLSSRKAIL